MTKRMGSVYALDCDLTTYGEDGAPVVTPEGTPVKVYMKYTLKNGLRRIVLRTPDGIGLDVSDEEAARRACAHRRRRSAGSTRASTTSTGRGCDGRAGQHAAVRPRR